MIIQIVLISALLYLAWALFHHRKDKSLTLLTLIEYLLTAVLVFVLVSGVLF